MRDKPEQLPLPFLAAYLGPTSSSSAGLIAGAVAGAVALLGGAVALAIGLRTDPVQQRASASPPTLPAAPPPAPGAADGWTELQNGPGLVVRRPRRAWTTPAVAAALERAAAVAAAGGGAIQIGEVAGPTRGAPLPPHRSHRWGRDVDVAYRLDTYPTPLALAPTAGWLASLLALGGDLEVVGVGRPRAVQLAEAAGVPDPHRLADDPLEKAVAAALGLPIAVWPGHLTHAHLRLRRELSAEPLA